jgi:diguanylate cyclase (GGDEF)-like protein
MSESTDKRPNGSDAGPAADARLPRRSAAPELQHLRRVNRQLQRRVAELTRILGDQPESQHSEDFAEHADASEGASYNHRLATIDLITGLPNRACFQDRLEQAIRYAERYEQSFGLLFIDLDNFKNVNDTMGHSAGDELLVQIGQRLTACVRRSDTVARLGGDEFTVILLNLKDRDLIAKVAEKICIELRRPFSVNGRDFYLTASIGISTYPPDGDNAEILIRNADIAMYQVKRDHKNGYLFFNREMSDQAIRRMELEDDLRNALLNEQFEIHYQVCVDTHSRKPVAVEALVRWRHPERGLVFPDEFIPVAEETGLIVELGRWVLMEACRQARAWQQAGYAPIAIAVNVSMLQFKQGNLVDTVMEALVASNLDSRWLELELTEGMIVRNADHAKGVLDRLRELGIRVAIDDFGTGYSSFMQLRRMPIDCLKIDRAFIREVLNNQDDASVVEAIVALGRKLNLTLVAEGIETAAQLKFLKNLGCQRCQGYLFGPPMPAAEFERSVLQRPSSPRDIDNSTSGSGPISEKSRFFQQSAH